MYALTIRDTLADIHGERYEHDVLIRLGGKIKRRKKKLSKRIYGTSHTISLDEARHVFEAGATALIVRSGQYGNVRLFPEAEQYFREQECEVRLSPTPQAIAVWNDAPRTAIGRFHVTC